MPPRLQRFFIRLMKYNYELKYVPGRQLVLADTLSRTLLAGSSWNSKDDDVEVHAVSVLSALVSKETYQRLVLEAAKDSVLSELNRSL